MITFAHGGRCGDLIFALATVKAICEWVDEKAKIYLTQHHAPVGWNEDLARSLIPLVEYQDYVESCELGNPSVDINLIDAEQDYNPEMFPEWHGKCWPGNVNIVKRYAVHFGVEPQGPWLTAPTHSHTDVACHISPRRITDREKLYRVIHDLYLQRKTISLTQEPKPECENALDFATKINSADVFFGVVSFGNAIAEGLCKPRFIQVAEGCDNVDFTTGYNINDWSVDQIVDSILRSLK